MDIIPLRSVRKEDVPLVGEAIFKLALLDRLNFPVADGVVILPPEIHLKTILEHYQLKGREILEQKLEIIKKDLLLIPSPSDLLEALHKKKIDQVKIWRELLVTWLEEIRKRFWQQGFYTDITKGLTAHVLIFSDSVFASGNVYYDKLENDSRITLSSGSLTPYQLKHIDELVQRGNKTLLIPYIYHFIVEKSGKVKLVKLDPYTQPVIDQASGARFQPPIVPHSKKKLTCALKIYLNLGDSFSVAENIDGVLIAAEATNDFEKQVLQLVESAEFSPNIPVIFRLSDKKDNLHGARGALFLLHSQNLLKSESEAFLFARNKKNLSNIDIAIPFVRSKNDCLNLKKELAILGISRKPNLKLWLECNIPENFLNLTSYLSVGIDGVIVNLDELNTWILGLDRLTEASRIPDLIYSSQTILNFLNAPFKKLHQEKALILVASNNHLPDELLEGLIEMGIYGLVLNKQMAAYAKEHVAFLEKRLIRKRLS